MGDKLHNLNHSEFTNSGSYARWSTPTQTEFTLPAYLVYLLTNQRHPFPPWHSLHYTLSLLLVSSLALCLDAPSHAPLVTSLAVYTAYQ